jgi:putative ABC transport system substrate-binding protein
MNRRDFITLLGGATAWPVAARAQQSALPVVGYLSTRSRGEDPQLVAGFLKGLGEVGYVEGRNAAIEYRWGENRNDQLPRLASDLVRRHVDVIAALSSPATLAAKAATTTLPTVFQVAVDPIAAGLVRSLARPSGNLTGVTSQSVEVGPKRLELLHELMPTVTNMALLVNPTIPLVADAMTKELQTAAQALGLQLQVLRASTEPEINAAFAALAQMRVGALVISPDPLFTNRSKQIAALAARYALPAISHIREFAAAGGVMSYGNDLADAYRLVGTYAGRILKGERPADLPVQQATKFELVINLKAAKALGITFPLTLLGRADEVIE